MAAGEADPGRRWQAALAAGALFARAPAALGGVWLRGPAGPLREAWLEALKAACPPHRPWRKLPVGVDEGRLLGGLDLGASLQAGRPQASAGLLAEADGGVLLVAMAERLPLRSAGVLAQVLDEGGLRIEREGFSGWRPARVGLVALDEAEGEDAPLAAALADRLALVVDLRGLPETLLRLPAGAPALDLVVLGREAAADADEAVASLCALADQLGVEGLRAPALAWRVARQLAEAAGQAGPGPQALGAAVGWVLAPRATRWPAPPAASEPPAEDAPPDGADPPPHEPPDSPPAPPPGDAPTDQPTDPPTDPDHGPAPGEAALPDQLLEALRGLMPPGLLLGLRPAGARARLAGRGGGQGDLVLAGSGRPLPARPGTPGPGCRLALLDTLRAAVPWQRLRGGLVAGEPGGRLQIRRPDLRVQRHAGRRPTVTLFLVDASGSAALHRLGEAKGAVEGLLAECYVRRDRVALLAFRGQGCELLLPPTRSLVRARRSLAGMVGGGGTPLATGLRSARALAAAERRRGCSPFLVVLSDGRANVALDGQGGRAQAREEALTLARACREDGLPALFIDTGAPPQAITLELALALGARHLPLPSGGSAGVVAAVRQAHAAHAP